MDTLNFPLIVNYDTPTDSSRVKMIENRYELILFINSAASRKLSVNSIN